MPKAKFESIYKDLKQKIESGEYPYQDLLPSENTMVNIYSSSRNTIRRAVLELAEQGYVQSLHGKGVRVIYQPIDQADFTLGGIESFKESAERNHRKTSTKVIQFTEITADARVSANTGFAPGSELYYIQRVRYLEDKALILDINMFLKSLVPGLTKDIAEKSIYEYIENEVGMAIVTSKRKMTVERATEIDEKYLELNDYNCLAVISGQTFNSDGIMFEFTQSRHRPDYFCFQDTATRKR
ncbi:trehalose operon repressor [Muricomes sp. OA1]|uniref:Trehalose operon repressor n=1 Tax=Hungatella hathewayi TaxID=154046 RepID=A0A3E2WXY1_9FIRM|nr:MULTISPECIES: trehalose operon repressor [Clostridia]MEE0200820.1 trehalose operon repressor [Muricomes sp.]MCH1974590.1 trehalose operon repressor [Muricomes sp. OA1]MRM89045.1 trehalose operon repressor [Faecalicatena contorta]RGC33025.1 trehalose operon repressor [Hungatella hathewayi]GKH33371.1 GntR family transcriptional regulator [Faecalicatena contorta]